MLSSLVNVRAWRRNEPQNNQMQRTAPGQMERRR
jgi:hypothetical protein